MNLDNPEGSGVELYQQLRMTGRSVISKLHEVARHPVFDLYQAARKLTIPVSDRTFVFDNPGQMSVLMDFYFHEMRYRGRRILDALAESDIGLTPDEREILTAHQVTRCSLFAIVSADPEACLIRLSDLLEPAAPQLDLMDISLSRSPITPNDLIFTRILVCRGIHMTGGFFPFRAVHRPHLLNAYAARMRTVPAKEHSLRTYIFFFRKCREIGMDHAYEENFEIRRSRRLDQAPGRQRLSRTHLNIQGVLLPLHHCRIQGHSFFVRGRRRHRGR